MLKTFMKWANSPEPDTATMDRMLIQLSQCEYAQKKSRLVSAMSQEELKNYETLSKEIQVEIEEAKKEIEKTKTELQVAKQVRKNRIEYDVLAKVINEQPDRQKTHIKLNTLREELDKLKVKMKIYFFFIKDYINFSIIYFLFLVAGEIRTFDTQD